MKEKIIAIDIDGTLVTDDSTLSKHTIEGIKKLTKMGYKIILTTGRTWLRAKPVYEACELDTPAVLYNGAAVYLPKEKKYLYYQTMDKQFIFDLMNHSEFLSSITNMISEDKNNSYLLQEIPWVEKEKQIIGNLKETLKEDPFSLVLMVKDKKAQLKVKEIITQNPHYDYRFWGDHFGEVYLKTLSKKEGIDIILNYYHTTKENLAFFGDGQNDVEIIQYAHCGIAMKNAKDYIKEMADEITQQDNNHDGVIHHIFEKINKKEKEETLC